MFSLDELLSVFDDVEEVEMSLSFAFVYSELVEEGTAAFWKGVRKHSLRDWYEKYSDMLSKDVKVEYTPVKIPKRTGGFRTLYIPSDQLKERQRAWLKLTYILVPKVMYAYAFERRRSLRDALEKHVGNYLFLRMDIKDAYPSIRKEVLASALEKYNVPNSISQMLIKDCYFRGLPQGAPTSGRLFNIVLSHTDLVIAEVISRLHGVYTRYADDILLSFPKGAFVSITQTCRTINQYLSKINLELHPSKLRVGKGKMRVLGCVVHSDKVTISRKIRRLYRAMLHNNETGKTPLSKHKINGIKGWLNMVYRSETVPAVGPIS